MPIPLSVRKAICVGASMTTQSHSLASSSKNLGAGHTNSSRRGKIRINRPSPQFSVISWRYSEKWQSSEGELLWHATVCAMIFPIQYYLCLTIRHNESERVSTECILSCMCTVQNKSLSVCLLCKRICLQVMYCTVQTSPVGQKHTKDA